MASMDLVYPGILLGNVNAARDLQGLQNAGVTHVLNCAAANCPSFYPQHFTYKSMMLTDTPSQNIMQHFGETSAFIREARNQGGAVFLHCIEGKSRSASCVIAFLMDTVGMALQDALGVVQGARPIVRPNEGFLIQLQHYEGIAWAGNGRRAMGFGLMSAASPAPLPAPMNQQWHHSQVANPHARHPHHLQHGNPPLPRQHFVGYSKQYLPQPMPEEQHNAWLAPNDAAPSNPNVTPGQMPMGYRPAGSYGYREGGFPTEHSLYESSPTAEHMSRYAAVYQQAQANANRRADAQRQEFQHFFQEDHHAPPKPIPGNDHSRPLARHGEVGLKANAPVEAARTDLGRINENMHVRLHAAEDSDDVDWSAVTQDSVFRQLMNSADDDDDQDQRDACGRVKKFVAGRSIVGKELTC